MHLINYFLIEERRRCLEIALSDSVNDCIVIVFAGVAVNMLDYYSLTVR